MIFSDYLKSKRSSGQYAFTADQAVAELDMTRNALNCAVYKLKKKNEIISPLEHLYIMVPPEHSSLGSLPAEELIPILMKYLNVPYYVCGLSAAYYHGSSHQKPQIFQVMTNKRLENIECGRVRIHFSYKKNLNLTQTISKVVKTGYLTVASVELTAYDLLNYSSLAGGLNPTVTVLSELIEQFNVDRLKELIESFSENAWWQRLGYIVEYLQSLDAEISYSILPLLQEFSKSRALNWVPLVPGLPKKGYPRNNVWKIIENTNIEIDE